MSEAGKSMLGYFIAGVMTVGAIVLAALGVSFNWELAGVFFAGFLFSGLLIDFDHFKAVLDKLPFLKKSNDEP